MPGRREADRSADDSVRRVKKWAVRNRLQLLAAMLALGAATTAASVYHLNSPKDPIVAYQSQLQSGHAVTLIPESGLPAWHRWAFGPTALGQAPERGNACCFETIENSMLELLSDAGVDDYEVRANLCLLRLRTPSGENAAAEPSNLAGLYFGSASPDGATRIFLAATYNDFLDPVMAQAGITKSVAQLRTVCLIPKAIAGRSPTAGAGRAIRFTPAKDLPADWRRVRVQVTAERVRVYWAADPETPDEKMDLLGDYSVDEVNRLFQTHRAALNAAQPGLGDAVPPWNPRMPIGIWCRGGAVAVKNVIVTPLLRK